MGQITSTTAPDELSPEFTEWLNTEKEDATSHQIRILKASVLMLFGTALFLLKLQPGWIIDMFSIAEAMAK